MAADPAGQVYGTALYEAAEASGRATAIERDLVAIRDAIAASPELTRLLDNPAFPARGKKDDPARARDRRRPARAQPAAGAGRQRPPDRALRRGRRRSRRALRESEQQLEVELTTAVPVDDDEADRLRDRIAEASGKDVTLRRRVDPAVVGGLVLRIGDQLIDASVRGRLDGLRLALRKARIAPGGQA